MVLPNVTLPCVEAMFGTVDELLLIEAVDALVMLALGTDNPLLVGLAATEIEMLAVLLLG
ncbi:hypothetical protein BJV82DRAFT_613720 [Fennellomyces sp. T-0311]|nr:hypothetical protein BJV82DRAFT_613720 [Fennellomyces sp. T-0311]